MCAVKPPPKLLFLYTALLRDKLRERPPILAEERSTSSTICGLLCRLLSALVGLAHLLVVLCAPCHLFVLFVLSPSLAIVSRSNSFDTTIAIFVDYDATTGRLSLS